KQISSKINTTVISTTVICLMLFLTICIFSSAFALNKAATAQLDELAPVDIQMQKNVEKDNLLISEYLAKKQISLDELKDIYTFTTYQTPQLTIRHTYGDYYEKTSESFLNSCEEIIKVSDYNKLAKLYNLPVYDLKEEYVVMGNYENTMYARNQFLKDKPKIELNGRVYYSKFNKCQNGFLSMQSSHMTMGVYIVPDDAVNGFSIDNSYLIGNYAAVDKGARNIVDERMNNYGSDTLLINTKIQISTNSIGMGAMIIFIGLYIGIVFLISCAAILALKELSQSIDNKEKYQILRKIGVDEKMINRSLFKQIAIYFTFPLILALIHSVFGIQVCNMMLQTFNQTNAFEAIITTGVFLVVIYGGYFIITYLCSKRIIKDK
ncbi:ABC transporter permease, partial [Thomasclavelia sp.]